MLQAVPQTLTSHFQKATAEADAAKRAAEAAVAAVAAAEVPAASNYVQLKEGAAAALAVPEETVGGSPTPQQEPRQPH